MDMFAVYEYACAMRGASASRPFGPQAVVLKVMEKVFALVGIERLPPTVTLKCDPDRAADLRERYAAVREGYHMNKRHWITLSLDGTISPSEIAALLDHSYDLVVAGLRVEDRRCLRSKI